MREKAKHKRELSTRESELSTRESYRHEGESQACERGLCMRQRAKDERGLHMRQT